jgi:hypothetical protein
MKAAVFCRTRDVRYLPDSHDRGGELVLVGDVPAVAYTSIMGVDALRRIVVVTRGGSAICGGGHAGRLTQEPEYLGVEPPGDL